MKVSVAMRIRPRRGTLSRWLLRSVPFLLPRSLTILLACSLPCINLAAQGPPLSGRQEDEATATLLDYETAIKPLFRDRCYACHGALKQQAGLRLDTAALMLSGGDSGPAIVAGSSHGSLLIERVSADDIADRMPPEHEGEPFSSEQLEQLRRWIEQGATAPADEVAESQPEQHWAYQPIVRPPVPAGAVGAGSNNPIDAFLTERHALEQLAPQPAAPRLLLLRRLYLDLIGLPPTPTELAQWENELQPNWYERVVEQLLNDPRYGERWGRHWMDIWRYSDWWGLGEQLRNSQQYMWHWRDWIIESLNADVPYDEMVRLMLAADELFPTDVRKLRATGFLARNFFLFNRNQWMDETVEHVSKGLLGITMNCAKCHDHKYDPLSQMDYYRLRAFFEPYHVRLDIVPGEADLSRQGIPRVFDGLLETPTYRFIRGEESMPDKSQVLSPAVPEFFDFTELKIAPVQLPVEAWQPGRLPWVIDAKLAEARQAVAAAQAKVAASQSKVSEMQQATEKVAAEALATASEEPSAASPAAVAATPPTLHDDFQTWDLSKWKTFGGEWRLEPGTLEQLKDDSQTAYLRSRIDIPSDFEAKLRFTIRGGHPYRSVGIAFDASQADPLSPAAAEDSQQMVYVSAFEGEPKVQIATQQAGQWQYPAEAKHPRAIALEHEYELLVQVRGQLINVALDGTHVIAWRTPMERRQGAMQLVAFTAQAAFHEFTVAPLTDHARLLDPPQGQAPHQAAPTTVEQAQLELSLAETGLGVAEAEVVFLDTCRRALERLRSDTLAASNTETTDSAANDSAASQTTDAAALQPNSRIEAIRAERALEVARRRHALASAELAQAPASGAAEPEAKAVEAARTELTAAIERCGAEIAPDEMFALPNGGAWTPTRFQISTSDDPTVAFPPTSSGRRTALAQWITDRRNPLTARVAVNHLWTRHMGGSLVPTEFDLGRKNAEPEYTRLLDWLAAELMDNGWSMKHLHRLIVTSAAYRMSSSLTGGEAQMQRDPDNRFWWRRVSTRLESQVIRDTVLAHAGLLEETIGGASVMPSEQADSQRRSLYFFHSNNERNLFLSSFDEARVQECYRREQSIVPQQALALSNSRLVLDATEPIAKRLSARADDVVDNALDNVLDDVQFIQRCFRVLLAIEASEAEIQASLRALTEWQELADSHADTTTPARTPRGQLVWALLNHNDFVTLR